MTAERGATLMLSVMTLSDCANGGRGRWAGVDWHEPIHIEKKGREMTDLDVKTEQTTIEEHSNEQKRLAICGNCAAFSKEPAVNINGMSEIEGICRRSHPSVFMTYAEENGIFYSKESEVSVSKLEKHFNIQATNFLWIDDSPRVLDVVKSFGCQTMLVTPTNRLVDILNTLQHKVL